MSLETLQPNTVQPTPEEQGGLTPDQQQEAVQLRENVLDRERSYLSTPEGNTVTQLWENDIKRGVRHQQQRLAVHAAKKHYKQNEGDYQVQALNEATEAGVEINGWPYEDKEYKHSAKRRLGNAALAAADGGTVAAIATTMVVPVSARDIIPAYIAYRYGKGAAARGAAAVIGKGDPEMAISTRNRRVSPITVHGSKKELKARRERIKRLA